MIRQASAILFVFFFIRCMNGHAQNLKFKHINVEQGLSNSTVECIFQDHRGFLWFGTRDGLNRYDGNQIATFKSNGKPGSISDNFIRCIIEDRQHNLWIGTSNGLNKFDPEKNIFTRYTSNSPNSNIIATIIENKQGIWVGTYGGGLFKTDEKNQRLAPFPYRINNSGRKDFINDLYSDGNAQLWIATDAGVDLLHTTNRRATTKLSGYKIRVIERARDGSFWMATEENGLIHFNPKGNAVKTYLHEEKENNTIGSNLVRAIAFDKQHNIWVGGINGGLNHFDPATDQFTHYENKAGNASSLSQRTVSALFVDKQGNLWVGTHRGGVNLYSPQAEKFNLFRQEPEKNSLSYNDVRAFYEAENGELYIGTDGGGLDVYNKKSRSFKHYRFNPFHAKSIGADAILDITNTKGGLLVGTWAGGLNRMNADRTFTRFNHDDKNPNSISSDYVQKSFEDSEHNVWIGTYYGGLNIFNPETNRFKRVIEGANGTRLAGNNIVAINEDHEKNLWIGTDDGGLNRYNLKAKVFTHYFMEGGKKPDLRVIFVDRKGGLWVGQAGLYRFDAHRNKFTIATQRAGLASDFIKGITEDERGHLWISTAKGLIQFNPQQQTFKKYNAADGLQGLEFESNAFLKTKRGEMFFGGINGFNSFFPKDIKTNGFVPPVYLTEVKIFNKVITPQTDEAILKNDISYTKRLDLDYDQATVAFRFAALNYVSSENNHYAYMLEGEDEEWINIGNNRQAIYTNLDPGNYTFKVRAANNDGIWNKEGVAIELHISPPFWASWWFRLAVMATAIYLAYLALSFRRRLELRKIEEEKREEIHQTQLQFFTNISHEFRTPLSLILGPIERLLNEDTQESFQSYYNTIHRNANRLLRLINELMDFRKTASGALKLNVTAGNLNLFVNEIAEEFREMAADRNISFTVENGNLLANVWFDRQIIEKIILNLVNNSLKYTQANGELKIQVLNSLKGITPLFENQLAIGSEYRGTEYVYFRVIDSGIGISKDSIQHLFERYYRITESHLGSGVGLAFVKSLTLLHKGLIKVSSGRNQGTEIIIGIPILESDYNAEEQFSRSTTAGGTRLESISYQNEMEKPALVMPAQIDHQEVPSILIVDDNDELRTFLKDTLAPQYQILEAADGINGVHIAQQHLPDLIISDVMMPGMNGTAFCKTIKENIETSHIPFLMLTAKNSVEAEIEGAESGADLYFTKPIHTNLLLITIRNVFEQRQKVKDHYSKNKEIQPPDLVHSEKDKLFMNKLLAIIDAQMVNPEMDIDYLCKEIGMSRTKLYQKLKAITGQSIGEFVRSARLRKAVEIMKSEDVLMTEVMYRIGIQTQSYFTKAFKKEFGVTPTAYIQGLEKKS